MPYIKLVKLLANTVDVILTSKLPKERSAESLIQKIISKVNNDYDGLCLILRALKKDHEDYHFYRQDIASTLLCAYP